MKVRVEITVEVDPKEWAEEYSMTDASAKAVREDVRGYVLEGVVSTYAGMTRMLKVL
jgi:hypothetical protein